jgi:RNA recognition motif-containing protein
MVRRCPIFNNFYRLNWATFGIGEKRPEMGPDYPIFVGDLSADVTDYMLQETFRSRYQTVKGVKVVTDRVTGRSKGYGFVRHINIVGWLENHLHNLEIIKYIEARTQTKI